MFGVGATVANLEHAGLSYVRQLRFEYEVVTLDLEGLGGEEEAYPQLAHHDAIG